jgi:hypothetical protein
MSAIITNEFRLDATQRFVSSLAQQTFDSNGNNLQDNYYVALGRAMAWDDETSPDEPYENDGTINNLWDNLYGLKKVDTNEIVSAAPCKLWATGRTYNEYDDQLPDIEAESVEYFIITNNNNVYVCIKSGPAGSTINPDTIGPKLTGVEELSDKYTWKYLFTVSIGTTDKFLTTDFVPVQYVTSNPGPDADLALQNQWSTQENAIDGALYNIKLTNAGGSVYTSAPTLTITGDGSGATAHVVMETADDGTGTLVETGYIDDMIIDTPGLGYSHATVVVSGGGGADAAGRCVIGPKGGFGADPRRDLRSHYIALNKVFLGSDAIPNTNEFRQIALIKNPLAANGSIASDPVYNACQSLEVTTNSTYTPDMLIKGTLSDARARVVSYDDTNGIIFFTQDLSTGYVTFVVNDVIREASEDTGGATVSQFNSADIKQYSGDVVFIENRQAVSRGEDQIETIRLVLAF